MENQVAEEKPTPLWVLTFRLKLAKKEAEALRGEMDLFHKLASEWWKKVQAQREVADKLEKEIKEKYPEHGK